MVTAELQNREGIRRCCSVSLSRSRDRDKVLSPQIMCILTLWLVNLTQRTKEKEISWIPTYTFSKNLSTINLFLVVNSSCGLLCFHAIPGSICNIKISRSMALKRREVKCLLGCKPVSAFDKYHRIGLVVRNMCA